MPLSLSSLMTEQKIISLSPVTLRWKVAVCFLKGGVVVITRRWEEYLDPLGRQPGVRADSILWTQAQTSSQFWLCTTWKLNLEVTAMALPLFCPAHSSEMGQQRQGRKLLPVLHKVQGHWTLQTASSWERQVEQAVLWFGFERYTVVYLGYLFPRTSGTVPGRLWISWKWELTSTRSLTGTAWPSFHPANPAMVFQDTNSCFHTSLLPFKDSYIRTPVAMDSNHSETMGHAKLSSQTRVAVMCFSHRDKKVNYTVSESSPLFLCPCQSLSGPRGVVVDQPPGIPIWCNIHHRGTKWCHHKKKKKRKKTPMILTMRYLLSSASPYGIFLFGYLPELLMGSTL